MSGESDASRTSVGETVGHLEARVTELEIKASFAEDTVEQLNQVVVRQQEQIERLNMLAGTAPSLVPWARVVETLLVTPSEDPRDVAARHIDSLPRSQDAIADTERFTRNHLVARQGQEIQYRLDYRVVVQ